MPPEPAETRDNGFVPHLTIVSDMGAIHDEIVVTDARAPPTLRSADVDGHMLANLGAGADLETGGLTTEFSILRRPPQTWAAT